MCFNKFFKKPSKTLCIKVHSTRKYFNTSYVIGNINNIFDFYGLYMEYILITLVSRTRFEIILRVFLSNTIVKEYTFIRVLLTIKNIVGT